MHIYIYYINIIWSMATITSHCHWVNPGWPSPSQTIWTLNVGGGGLQIPQSFATTAVNRSWQLHCFGDHMTNPKGKKQGQNAKTWKGRHVRKSINAWSRYFFLETCSTNVAHCIGVSASDDRSLRSIHSFFESDIPAKYRPTRPHIRRTRLLSGFPNMSPV